MPDATTQELSSRIRARAARIDGRVDHIGLLLDDIGDARIVLLGEATHGTHEFYSTRAEITQRLISDLGFNLVAVEADWPDAYRVNRHVRGSNHGDGLGALAEFKRFPTWMWRNTDVLTFVEWLAQFNRGRVATDQVGFYGLDLYSLFASIAAVIQYLERIDPQAAARARRRYACFEPFQLDPQGYGATARLPLSQTCEDAVLAQLVDLHRHSLDYLRRDGFAAEEEYFFAEQNARLARNAEQYYRSLFGNRAESWNLRDLHMAETLQALLRHRERHGNAARAVVWAHNSHLGDARATEMSALGELNLGQLVRERFGGSAYSVGFTTYRGTVAAASNWDAAVERKVLRAALPDSYEALFHETGLDRFLLRLRREHQPPAELHERRLERAVGVVYRPETERSSHYFEAALAEQFDAVIHLDRTRAVDPLDHSPGWTRGDLPETFPSGQ